MPPFDPERLARIRARIVAAVAVAGATGVVACERPLAPNTPDPNTVRTINEPAQPSVALPINPPVTPPPTINNPPTPTPTVTATGTINTPRPADPPPPQPTGSASAPPAPSTRPTHTMNPPPTPRPLVPPGNG